MAEDDGDLEYWEESYRKALDDASEAVLRVNDIVEDGGEEKKKLMSDAEVCIKEAKSARKSYLLELGQVREKERKERNQSKEHELEERLNLIVRQLEDCKFLCERSELLSADGKADEFKDNDAYLAAAEKLQEETSSSLARTRQLIEDSKEVGSATVNLLEKQSDQLQGISTDLHRMDSNLQRSDALIKDFTSRMLGDSVIRIFTSINFLLVIIILIYVGLTGKSLSNVTSAEKEDSNPGGSD